MDYVDLFGGLKVKEEFNQFCSSPFVIAVKQMRRNKRRSILWSTTKGGSLMMSGVAKSK